MTYRQIISTFTLCMFICYNSIAQNKYGDNLGSHKATKNIDMNNHQIIQANPLIMNSTNVSNIYIGLQVKGNNQTILLSRVSNLLGANPSIPIDKAVNGMIIYDNATSKFYVRQTGKWTSFLSQLSQNYLWIGNTTNFAVAVAVTGDISIDRTGLVTIQANKVNSVKLAKNTIKSIDVALGTLLLPKIKPSSVPGDQITIKTSGTGWSAPAANNFFNIGDFQMIATNTAPSGWLLCDGTTKSRTAYPKLFATIGTSYGSGDGTTTFTLPDLRGRIAGGTGSVTGLTSRTIGQFVGTERNTMSIAQMPTHNHGGSGTTDTAGNHFHTTGRRRINNDSGRSIAPSSSETPTSNSTSEAGAHSHTVTINNRGSGTAFNNMAPTLFTGNYYIYTGES
jgi:microcystin-dependent protein